MYYQQTHALRTLSLRIKAQYQTVDEPSGKILFDFLSQKILFSSFRAPN